MTTTRIMGACVMAILVAGGCRKDHVEENKQDDPAPAQRGVTGSRGALPGANEPNDFGTYGKAAPETGAPAAGQAGGSAAGGIGAGAGTGAPALDQGKRPGSAGMSGDRTEGSSGVTPRDGGVEDGGVGDAAAR